MNDNIPMLIYDEETMLDWVFEMSKTEMLKFLKFAQEFLDARFEGFLSKGKNPGNFTHEELVAYMNALLKDNALRHKFYTKLSRTPETKKCYDLLVWEEDVVDAMRLPLRSMPHATYNPKFLSGDLQFIRVERVDYFGMGFETAATIPYKIRRILRFFYAVPRDFNLHPAPKRATKYHLNNEPRIFPVIDNLRDMVDAGSIEIGKTAEKPLAKSLRLAKSIDPDIEFFQTKGRDSLATDMIVRTAYFYGTVRNFVSLR